MNLHSNKDIDSLGRAAGDDSRRRASSSNSDSALVELLAAPNRSNRFDRGRMLALAAAIVVLALVASVAVVAERQGDGGQEAVIEKPNPTRPARALPVTPLGPTDGYESVGLPVQVEPSNGLVDGQTVEVGGSGFGPGEMVGVVLCGSEGVTAEPRTGGCDLDTVVTASADGDGVVTADFQVRRTITTGSFGIIDCAEAPERCFIGIGALNDYDRSGYMPVTFAGAAEPPAAPRSIEVSPAENISDGDAALVTVRNIPVGRSLELQQCTTVIQPACVPLASPDEPIAANEDGKFEVKIRLWRWIPDGDSYLDCVTHQCQVKVGPVFGYEGEDSFAAHSGILGFSETGEPPPAPTLMVNPSRDLRVGDKISILGSDYGPDVAVSFQVCSQPKSKGSIADCSSLGKLGSDLVTQERGDFGLATEFNPDETTGATVTCSGAGTTCLVYAILRPNRVGEHRPTITPPPVEITLAG